MAGVSPQPTSRRKAAKRFDTQAPTFDRRTGFPPDAAAQISRAILERDDQETAGDEVVLELGAGTGGLGLHLADLAARYVGVDLSLPMLEVFGDKLAPRAPGSGGPLLVQADGDRYWPVRDGSVSVVFASRVAHLLRAPHVVEEVARVCRAGGRFVIGRIQRSGVKQQLRRQRELMLADRGVAGHRSGDRRTDALLDALVAAGGTAEPKRTVATWTTAVTAEKVISGWEGMATMGGEDVAPEIRVEVLSELREWARDQFGDLGQPHDSSEHYSLHGVRLG